MTYDLLQKFYSSLSTRTTTEKNDHQLLRAIHFSLIVTRCSECLFFVRVVVGMLCAARCVIGLRIQDTGRAHIYTKQRVYYV